MESLREQKVVEVRKILKKESDKTPTTGAAVIRFDYVHRRDTLKLGWEKVPVEEYIPNLLKS